MKLIFKQAEVFQAACAVLVNDPANPYRGFLRLEGAQRRIVATDNFFLLLCDDAFSTDEPLGEAIWYVRPAKPLRKRTLGPVIIDLSAGLIRANGQIIEATCLSGERVPHYPERYEHVLYDPNLSGVCANMFSLDLKRALEIVSALDPQGHCWPWRMVHDDAYELAHPGPRSLRVVAGKLPTKHPELFIIDETKARLAKLHGVRS